MSTGKFFTGIKLYKKIYLKKVIAHTSCVECFENFTIVTFSQEIIDLNT